MPLVDLAVEATEGLVVLAVVLSCKAPEQGVDTVSAQLEPLLGPEPPAALALALSTFLALPLAAATVEQG